MNDSRTADATSGANTPAKGEARLLTLADVDRRTRGYQRAVEIRAGIMADLGGEDRLSVAERELAQRAAVLGPMIEDAEVRWLKGQANDPGEHLAQINAQRRVRRHSVWIDGLRDVTPDLATYQRQKAEAQS
jgi:hypothetical protein